MEFTKITFAFDMVVCVVLGPSLRFLEYIISTTFIRMCRLEFLRCDCVSYYL